MTDAYKIDEEQKTATFDLTRLPATTEVIRPSDFKRRNLIAAVSGVFSLVLFAAMLWLVEYLDAATFLPNWQEFMLVSAICTLVLIAVFVLVYMVYGLACWNRRKLVTIGDTYVEITRWPLIGSRKFNYVPLRDYAGVAKEFEDFGKQEAGYYISLVHDEASLSVLLYSSESPTDWDEKWRHYADRLDLPAIDEGHRPKKAKVDGTPAMKVLPGAIFTLDVDHLPAAAVFDVPPGDRFLGLFWGLAMIGVSGAFLWAFCRSTPRLPENVEEVLFLLIPLLFGFLGFWFAAKSHLAYRTVLIDQNHVTGTRRRLSGMDRWVEPISAFRGVRGSVGKKTVFSDVRTEKAVFSGNTEKAIRYAVTLVHPDRYKSAILYRAGYEDDLASKLQYYADRLGVPILDEESG